MSSVLIAYNNDCNTELHHFFESCSDEAKQACLDNKITFESVCPPNLNADKVCGKMESNSLCVIVSHGIMVRLSTKITKKSSLSIQQTIILPTKDFTL